MRRWGFSMSDEGENYRPFSPTWGAQACSLGAFPPTPPPPLSPPTSLCVGLRLVVGEKCELRERGWKLCTEVKGSVGGSGRKSETPVYPELSLMPQSQRAQGLPLHASHPPYFLSFKFPSARTPGPQD